MRKTTLAIQSFGREYEYRRAVLTILSYYAVTSLPVAETRVMLFTDKPEWFAPFLDGLPVEVVLLTPEKIRAMRGDIDFLHRMKIEVIEETFSRTDGNMLYADSDTFFTADPTPLERTLTPDTCFMHLWEYPFSETKLQELPAGASQQAFHKLITTKTFTDAQGAPVPVTEEMSSWNAGVMFFHPAHARFIPDVYALTHQFYPDTQNHASEQFAFSVMMQLHTKLQPCDHVIYHYWYRIKKKITDQFLGARLDAAFAALPLAAKLERVRTWIGQLPGLYETHYWTIQDHAIQAFNERHYAEGYKWTIRALIQRPVGNGTFLADTLYHIKNHITGNGR